jgi:hypothetical protein
VAVAKWNYTLLGWAVIQSSNRSATASGARRASSGLLPPRLVSMGGYAIAAVTAVTGFTLAFRDLS